MDWKLDNIQKLLEQPAPKPNGNKPVWDMVISDMIKRNQLGEAKYGTPLQVFNGRDALRDAYEEALDLCVYLRQAISERDARKLEWGKENVVYETCNEIFDSLLEACLVADEYAVRNNEVIKVYALTIGGLRTVAYVSDGVAAQEEMRNMPQKVVECQRIKLR